MEEEEEEGSIWLQQPNLQAVYARHWANCLVTIISFHSDHKFMGQLPCQMEKTCAGKLSHSRVTQLLAADPGSNPHNALMKLKCFPQDTESTPSPREQPLPIKAICENNKGAGPGTSTTWRWEMAGQWVSPGSGGAPNLLY